MQQFRQSLRLDEKQAKRHILQWHFDLYRWNFLHNDIDDHDKHSFDNSGESRLQLQLLHRRVHLFDLRHLDNHYCRRFDFLSKEAGGRKIRLAHWTCV